MSKNQSSSKVAPDHTQKTMTKRILIAWLLVSVMVFGGFAYFSFDERKQVLEHAGQDSQLIASRAAAHADRIFEGMDMALVALETLLGRDRDWDRIAADRAKWLVLRRWGITLPVVPRLVVADADGRIRLHSDVFPAPPRSLAERGYFRRHRTEAADRAIIGDPVTGLISGQLVLTLSRRLSSRDGSFNGVAVANISPDKLQEFYETLGTGPGGNVMLLRADGTILAHAPAKAGVVGTKLVLLAMLPGIAAGEHTGLNPAASDSKGMQRIAAFHRLDRSDAYTVSMVSIDDVLVDWRRSTWRTFLILMFSFAGLTILLVRLLRHRAREIAARSSQAESELRFRTLFEQAAVGVGLIETATGRFLQVNQKYCDIVGYTRKEMEQLDFQTITHPDDLGADLANMDRLKAGEIADFTMEKRYFRKDGAIVWVSLTVSPMWVPGAPPDHHIAIVQDISGRKQAEEALRESEEIFSQFMQHSPIYVFFKDEAIRAIKLSSNFEKMLGKPVHELLGKTMDELFPSDLAKSMIADDLRILTEEKKIDIEEEFNGRIYSTTKFPIYHDGKARYLAGYTIDITERRKLEQQLLQAQKMEAVGQLAGGIAHDFNNILTAIIGYGNVALMKLHADDPVRSSIDQILASADRAAELTRSLLAFSRKQIINPQPVTVNSIIDRVRNLLHRVIGEDIELRTVLTAQDTTVLADSGQIEQLLINLATNARDAMPKGGQLTIETGLAQIDDEYIRRHGYGKTGDYVLISVSDTGEGMDEPTRQRVFEPFFTTKEVGKGTGLGLAMVYGSVKQQNGYINVYSEPGKGTTFKIYLPVLHAAALPLALSNSHGMPKGGNETILLAEDDQTVRNLTRSVLEDVGYTVIEAADGREAVEKLEQQRDRIDLLIADVVMPMKNGKEVAEEARRMKPGIKVLFTSGYPANIIQGKGIIEQGLSFISKPAPLHDLLRKIREVLDQ